MTDTVRPGPDAPPAGNPSLIRTNSLAINTIGNSFFPQLHNVYRSVKVNPQFFSIAGLARTASYASFVGSVMMWGVCLAYWSTEYRQFGIYAVLLSLFHMLEFYLTAVFHPRDLTCTSFLLNHSKAYNLALAAGWLEYWIEALFFPHFKRRLFFSVIGFLMTIAGQVIRTVAMWSAGTNFTHLIMLVKRPKHELVTTGIYAYSRHPSYAGWWWWCVGTQLLLGNPICVFAYAIVAWKFFESRIKFEEETLYEFFGQQYRDYHAKVGTGIPLLRTGVPGLLIEAAMRGATQGNLGTGTVNLGDGNTSPVYPQLQPKTE